MKLPTKEETRARFWELKALVDAAKEAIVPLREARDAFVNEYNNREKDTELMTPILAVGADVGNGMSLFEAEQEMAACARFLGGVVGEPEEG